MMVMSVSAQSLAQEPQIGFQSTSSMVGSGSTLPQAAQYGAYTTYDADNNSGQFHKPGLRRGLGEGDDDVTTPDDNADPDATPIGDGVWAMVLLACAYVIFRYVRTRKSSHVAAQR